MSKKLRETTYPRVDQYNATTALAKLREARDLLVSIGADRAAAKVRLAIKSADGAARHATRILGERLAKERA